MLNLYPWTTLGGGLSTLDHRVGVITYIKGVKIDTLIVGLVILVPFVPCVNTVEVARLSRSIFVLPIVAGSTSNILLEIEQFFLFVQFSFGLCTIQGFRGKVAISRRIFDLRLSRLLSSFWNISGSGDGTALLYL